MARNFANKKSLLVCELAWHFANRASDKAKAENLFFIQKLRRCLHKLQRQYEHWLCYRVEPSILTEVRNMAAQYLSNQQSHLIQMYFCLSEEFKKAHPTWMYDELRTSALMGRLMVKAYKNAGGSDFPCINALDEVCKGYVGDEVFYGSKSIDIAMKTFMIDVEAALSK